jgi:adenylyl cyclase-associated protein
VVEIQDNKQTVQIYKCEDSVIIVKGKCTSISISKFPCRKKFSFYYLPYFLTPREKKDNSRKTAVIFDNIIATVEVANCQSIQLQSNGVIPSISIDKTNGTIIYLQAPEGKNVEIISSASTELNVVTPGKREKNCSLKNQKKNPNSFCLGKTESDDPREQAIPQQFVTTFASDGRIVTKPTEHVGV